MNQTFHSLMKKLLVRRWNTRTLVITCALLSVGAYAMAGGGTATAAAGLEQANTGIRAMWPTVQKLMFTVMAIIGLVGAASVYGKWSNGDPDTRKAAASWFGALIFAGLVVVILGAVFSPG